MTSAKNERVMMSRKTSPTRVVDYIADTVSDLGVRHVFMLTGTGSVFLDDAFAFHDRMQYTCARHEAAAVLMATGAAKLTGVPGVVISTTGPGATNAIGGVVEAWVDSVPLIVLSGQVPTAQNIPKIKSFGIQGFNVIENVQHITKYAARVDDPASIRYHLERAIHEATSGCPGPVWLDLPMDVQAAEVDVARMTSFALPARDEAAPTADVSRVADMLAAAKRPLMVFGQGIRQAGAIDNLDRMLTETGMPSICSRMGLDILPSDYPGFYGLGGVRGTCVANSIMQQADMLLVIGSSYTHAFAGETYQFKNPGAKLAMVNIAPEEMHKPGMAIDLALQMDAKDFLVQLDEALAGRVDTQSMAAWTAHCRRLRDCAAPMLAPPRSNPINSYYLIECLNNCTSGEHIFTNDAGSANYVSSQGLRLEKGQRELTSGAFYSMGIALPLAIGASAVEPEKQVIVVTGDGSIELNIQELRTAALGRMNIKVFIINNGGYASIRKSQDEMADGRYTDDQTVLNFRKVAEAFELRYLLLDDAATLEAGIASELGADDPCLIEVICEPEQSINDALAHIDTMAVAAQ